MVCPAANALFFTALAGLPAQKSPPMKAGFKDFVPF